MVGPNPHTRLRAALMLLLALLLTACRAQAPTPAANAAWTSVAPAPLPPEQNVPNPGRGFYTSNLDLFSQDEADYAAVRKAGLTLAYPYGTWLPRRELSQGELDALQRGFDLVRKYGFKLILRFRYGEDGDADWSIIQRHLEQLAPLIRKNADVIAVLQAGFLGRWGEWHCWQASGPCHDGAEEKQFVLDKLLAALAGTDVPVAVRYPPDKARYLGELSYPDYEHVPPPPEPVRGFADTEGVRARIAHHNDCFLSGTDDVGTYPNNPPERTGQWRDFVYQENDYLPYGGETCAAGDPSDPDRARGARALEELARAHLDYLNLDYHPGMLANWRKDGIFDEIAARMGYRLVVEEAAWSAPAPGRYWAFRLKLKNDGFSRLKRRYDAVLVLRAQDGAVREYPLDFDLRQVAPGREATFAAQGLEAPPAGSWRLGLAVRDPALPDRPEYAVRFASELDYDGTHWLGWWQRTP